MEAESVDDRVGFLRTAICCSALKLRTGWLRRFALPCCAAAALSIRATSARFALGLFNVDDVAFGQLEPEWSAVKGGCDRSPIVIVGYRLSTYCHSDSAFLAFLCCYGDPMDMLH